MLCVCLGCSEWEWCGSICDKWGQEPGLRPADGPFSLTPRPFLTAQRQQPHGNFLWVLPTTGQPLHTLPWLLPLCWDRRPLREIREKATEGGWGAALGKRLWNYKLLIIWSSSGQVTLLEKNESEWSFYIEATQGPIVTYLDINVMIIINK